MKNRPYKHWTSTVQRSVKLWRLRNYPHKLKTVLGDPRTRVGSFYGDLHELARRFSYYGNLTSFEFRVFSQNGEDGVIAELIRRIGDDCPRVFVEFGTGSGRSGNCVFLADVLAWEGLFIEPADNDFKLLQEKYAYSRRVRTVQEFVSPENIDSIVTAAGLARVGVMSIDVDGNDYYIWRAMNIRPIVVVVEYNGSLPLNQVLIQPFNDKQWDGTNFFGSSLQALVDLGTEKGYTLVHTEMSGTNAFFVATEYAHAFADVLEVPRRVANFELLGFIHPADREGRTYLNAAPGPVSGD